MSSTAVSFAIAYMALCFLLALVHSARVGRATLVDWTLIALGLVHGGAWALILTSDQQSPLVQRWVVSGSTWLAVHTLSSAVLAGTILIGWQLGGLAPQFTFGSTRSEGIFFPERWRRLAWLTLALGVLFQIAYTQAYGGPIAILEQSELIRSGIFTVDNPLSFLQPFAGLGVFSSFIFFGLILSGYRLGQVYVGLLLSVSFSLYLFLTYLARLSFAIYVATLLVGLGLYLRARPRQLFAATVGGAWALIGGLYLLSNWLGLKGATSMREFAVKEMSFPFVSFFAQFGNSGGKRFFIDIFFAPLYLLPSSWWGQWLTPVEAENTALILGAAKGEGGVTGGIPLDLLTLGWVQYGVLGVVVLGVLFGAVLRAIQNLTTRIPDRGVRAVLEAYIALKIAMMGILYSQPSHLIGGNFSLLFFAALATVFLRWRGQIIPRVRLVAT